MVVVVPTLVGGSVTTLRVVIGAVLVVVGFCVQEAAPVHGQIRKPKSATVDLEAHVAAVNGKLTFLQAAAE